MKRKTLKSPKKKAVEASSIGTQKTPTGRTRKALNPDYKLTRATSSNGATSPRFIRTQQFARLLRAAMIGKGIKQIQLAELTKIGRDSISGYCNGHNVPGEDNLKLLANALDVRPEELLPAFGMISQHGSQGATFLIHDDASGKGSWLTVNRPIPTHLLSKVIELFHQFKLADAADEQRLKKRKD